MGVEALLAELGEQSGDISVQCSKTGGQLAQLNRQMRAEADRLEDLVRAMAMLDTSQGESREATEELLRTAELAQVVLERGNNVAHRSLAEVMALVDGVTSLDGQLQSFLDRLGTIGGISRTLSEIAEQTQMLSFNARIEAARGGEATRPFEVLADEIRHLADTTSRSAGGVARNIEGLQQTAQQLIGGVRGNIEAGRETTRHIDSLRGALNEMAALVLQFQDRSKAIAKSNDNAGRAAETLGIGLAEFREVAGESAARAEEARSRLDRLEVRANDMFNQVAHGGVPTRNSPFIVLALLGAREATQVIEAHLASGELTEEALFDTAYRERARSDPEQFDNLFADFADRIIRPLLDARTEDDPAIVGCCLVDLNGYLPTHITERSRPQISGDRLHNREFSRNRQIFLDSHIQRALELDGEFCLFAYRQNLGGGRFRALRSVFVPLRFNGRKWGLYEVGYVI